MVPAMSTTDSVEAVLLANLKSIVKAYASATGRTEVAISKEFYGNAGFLGDFLREEKSMSVRKYSEIVEGLRAKWPAGTAWPLLRVVTFRAPARGKISPKKSSAA